MALPRVSVVTPSYNSVRFLEETIRSVLEQDYPDIEYLVMDGGSRDGSLEVLKKYGDRLRYESGPDEGQPDAVNRGFRKSSGEIFAFLNADDLYLPGAVAAAVQALKEHPEAGAVYGDAYHIDERGEILGPYPTEDFSPETLRRRCFICQPAAFMRREAFERAGLLNPRLQFSLDYDLWIRMARLYPLARVSGFLAKSRMHPENKTLGSRGEVYREVMAVLMTHYGFVPYEWVYGYVSWLLDRRDQFFDPMRPSKLRGGLALLLGAWRNRRHPLRYGSDAVRALRPGRPPEP
ncbi:MAG: glycosyltransferase [Bryobacterales bacterium]|nr:glycosyltransferase [Bryobacterales bacterium]